MNDSETLPSGSYSHGEIRPVDGVPLKRISWSAIFAGVIIAMVLYLLLTILGTAVGASTIDPLQENNPLNKLGVGATIWTGVSMLVSIALGAYISGRLAQREGALHGLLMFGVYALICTWFLVVAVNSAMSGAMNVVGSGLQLLGNGISATAPTVGDIVKDKLSDNNINLDNLRNELETMLRQTGKSELQPEKLKNQVGTEINNAGNQVDATASHPQTANTDIANFIQGLINRNQATFQAADRDALKNIIRARSGKSDAEVEQMVSHAEKTYQLARTQYDELKQLAEQKARQAGEQAAAATAKASWFAFFMLIVEAVLAGAMGMLGHRTQPVRVFSHTHRS